MSVWTHVVGNIRVDGVPALGGLRLDHVRSLLGPMCLFDVWDDVSWLPRGSEGGLRYQIIEYAHGLPWIAIPVWGDLRDYDDLEEIERWFTGLIGELKFVRDAVLQAEVEGGDQLVLAYYGTRFFRERRTPDGTSWWR